MALALEGIKVVDVSQMAAVPMAARHLADFGADVIHVENPATGDFWRGYQAGQGSGTSGVPSEINYNWENYNRNKRSLTLDLSQEGGRNIIYKLLEKADVFVSNLRPFELERFKLEYETLSRLNPRLIYGSLTGYGRKGPDKDLPAYDTTAYWARSGIPYMLTMAGTPGPGSRPAFGDNVTALALALGVMMALFVRERTGIGQEVDMALFHAGLYQIGFDIAGTLATGVDYGDWREKPSPELVAEAQAATAPIAAFYRSTILNPLAMRYVTKDGRMIHFVALQADRYWSRFCRAIEREDLENDPRFNSFEARAENRAALYSILDETFLSKTLDEWKPRLTGMPWAPYQNLREAIKDPQARANDFFVAYDHPAHGRIEGVANPAKLSKTPATMRMAAPEFGQHTEEILLEYGYTWEDIAQLKEQGVIA
ncbi:CaiB/BaiF CoA transferase family protein [Chloroflexota bacterium]